VRLTAVKNWRVCRYELLVAAKSRAFGSHLCVPALVDVVGLDHKLKGKRLVSQFKRIRQPHFLVVGKILLAVVQLQQVAFLAEQLCEYAVFVLAVRFSVFLGIMLSLPKLPFL
jgi:hypothetical protein